MKRAKLEEVLLVSRLPRKSVAALIPVALFAGAIALRVGHDEPRLVRTAGVSAPLVESTTSTSTVSAAETAKVAELDATVENHEARISILESTTSTAPAADAPVASSPVAPAVEAEPTTTTTVLSTSTTQAAPTTTTTWLCVVPSESGFGSRKVPCDSTTTTAPVG